MALMGPQGLRRTALACHEQTSLLRKQLLAIKGVTPLFSGPFFHEFPIRLSCHADQVLAKLAQKKIQGGYLLSNTYTELGESLLVCATETKTQEELTQFSNALAEEMHHV